MKRFAPLFDRLVPALVMASSVMLLTAGLLSYPPSAFGDWRTPEPVIDGDPFLPTGPVANRPTPTAVSHGPGASNEPTPVPLSTPPMAGQTNDPGSTPRPAPAEAGVVSRIRIPSLHVDLPVVPGDLVVPGNREFYPLCDVAMFMREYVQPGEAGATYIYAHAQRGMFAPLLEASQMNNGASMVGALIEVYTTTNTLHLYELYQVKRHATDLSLANAPTGVHLLVLQTSEGESGTIPKLQVAARPLSVVPSTPSEALPTPRPRVCLPD
jgi:hypothetical protein